MTGLYLNEKNMNNLAQSKIQSLVYSGFSQISKEALLSTKQKENLLCVCDLSLLDSITKIAKDKNVNPQTFKIHLHNVKKLYKLTNNLSLLKLVLSRISDADIMRVCNEKRDNTKS